MGRPYAIGLLLLQLAILLLCLSACSASSVPVPIPPSAPASTLVHPFQIRVPDETLSLLQQKLALTTLPAQDESDGWERGTNVRYLSELLDFWRAGNDSSSRPHYDWRARERELNKLPHFHTQIDDYTIHFIHARSPRPDAVPLLFVHGWPGSFLECLKVLPGLTNPPDAATPAFHVVCPSMPGYGFSSARSSQRTGIRDVARLFVKLMARLGHDRYVAQGGDWGAFVASHMAQSDAEHCRGLHINMAVITPPLALFATRNPFYALWRGLNTIVDLIMPRWRFEEQEANMVINPPMQLFDISGYFHSQSTRPDTLGVALEDSPAGLASWLVEKYRAWSDCDGDVERVWSKTDLLDHITLYYVTRSITSSMRLYYETAHPSAPGARSMVADLAAWDVRVPTGVAVFPKEILSAPRKHYSFLPRGGHFAALEEPQLWLEDVRSFVREHVLSDNWHTNMHNEQKDAANKADL